MTEFNKMKITHFYYNYLLVVCLITSIFNWFNGDLFSWLRLFLVLLVPLPIAWRNNRRAEERLPASHFSALVLTGIIATQGIFGNEETANIMVCCCTFIAALFVFFLNKYLRGRYTILHCNPSVSEETKRRAGQMQRKPLLILSCVGGIALLLFVLLSTMIARIEWEPRERSHREQQEQDNMLEERQDVKRSEIQRKVREEQEQASDNFWLRLLRYVVIFAVVVMGALAIVYAVYRLILYLMKYRRKLIYEYEELVDEETDFDEITRLVPVVKKAMVFPDGWDGKIRRAFYESVRKGAGKKSINCSLTPRELHREYMSETEQDECLTRLYEKARYAEDSISREEWGTWIEISQNKR